MSGLAVAICKGIGTVFFGSVCVSSFFLSLLSYQTTVLYWKDVKADRALFREWCMLTLIAFLGLASSALALYRIWF